MSHQVLARKWRPSRFEDLVGQPHVVRALANALSGDRLHHAYLFAGTRGVGKTTIARILARCLNCETGVTATPCGECRSCVEIAEGRHLDLIEVDAASRTRVDDTRELLDNVSYAPTTGRFKVYLIDEVHMLSEKSFNALLKTLEEPPDHVKFLLATTDPQKLPVTVLSRCLQFNLKPMPPAMIAEHLTRILAAEGVEAEPGALLRLGEAAEGSMRDALSLTDQAIAYGGERLSESDACDMLGLLPRTRLAGLLDAVFAGDGPGLLAGLAELDALGPDWSRLLDELAALVHQVAVQQVAGTAPGAGEEALVWAREAADRVDPETIQLAYQILVHGVRDLPYAPDARMGVEMTLLRLLAFRPEPVPGPAGEFGDTPPRRPAGPDGTAPAPSTRTASRASAASASPPATAAGPTGGAGAASAPPSRPREQVNEPAPPVPQAEAPAGGTAPRQAREASPSTAGPSAPEAAARPVAADGAFDWYRFAEGLPMGTVRELARHAELREHDAERVVIAVAPGTLCTDRAKGRLKDALENALGHSLRLEIVNQSEPSGETPAARLAAASAERQASAETAMREDPVVQALGEEFGAELGAVRIREPGETPSTGGATPDK
ncbi:MULTISPECIES: DNA polymerase III subunit gamma/tau [unclassified Thioalkalivibrio]|uniref:DNA polymerase III subunit gamma/tau n=1 Tax=unclassified Thioalkalivibrio TaxID=2621013 RepID=UPI00035FBEFA|nr:MULTISPECIES: DNA polymerase III subunit gamma/tau [unclassified Thioalkalivibrio]